MVRTRVDPDLKLFREDTVEILQRFGRTITRVAITETFNAAGRVLSTTEAETSFRGDIQYLTDQDKLFLREGVPTTGVAKLYTTFDVTLNENDELDVDSVRWKLIQKINSPDIDGGRDFQLWLIQRRD